MSNNPDSKVKLKSMQILRKATWESLHSPKGKSRATNGLRESTLAFILSGKVSISIDKFQHRIIQAGQAILLPLNTPYKAEALEDSHVIACLFSLGTLLSADYPINKLVLLSKKIDYNLDLLPINSSINNCTS